MRATALLVLASCTLTRPEVDPCTSRSQCQSTFGPGYTCATDGLCHQVSSYPRCSRSYPDDLLSNPSAHTDAILVASLVDASLQSSRARENAVRLAVKQANLQGGLSGKTFGVVLCTTEENAELDALTRTEASVATARYVTEQLGVVAIVGPGSSTDVQAVFEAIAGSGTLVMTPSATSPALTSLDTQSPGLLWRTAPPDSLQALAIAADMVDPGLGRAVPANRVGIVYERGTYGQALSETFAAAFPPPPTGYLKQFAFSGATERDEQVAAASTGTFDEVLFISSRATDAIAFSQTVATLPGFTDKHIFLTDTAASSDFLKNANPTVFTKLRGARPAPLDPGKDAVYAAFLAVYQSEYGEDARSQSYSAHAYDAAWLVMYGAAWSQLHHAAISGTGIAEGLQHVSAGAPVDIRATTWPGILERLSAGEGIDVNGASGALDYDPVTEETSGPIEIWTVQDGQLARSDLWMP